MFYVFQIQVVQACLQRLDREQRQLTRHTQEVTQQVDARHDSLVTWARQSRDEMLEEVKAKEDVCTNQLQADKAAASLAMDRLSLLVSRAARADGSDGDVLLLRKELRAALLSQDRLDRHTEQPHTQGALWGCSWHVSDVSLLDRETVKAYMGRVVEGADDVSRPAGILSQLTEKVERLMADMTQANTNIANNTTSIAANTTNIATSVTGLTANIATNTSSTSELNANFTTIKTSVDNNTTKIAANTTNIAANTTNISSNTTNIAANTTNIAANTTNIATNTTNIAANTTNIAANTTNIATNTTNIATNTTSIATNTTNIAANTTNIAGGVGGGEMKKGWGRDDGEMKKGWGLRWRRGGGGMEEGWGLRWRTGGGGMEEGWG